MSTVDPRIARAHREQQEAASPRRRIVDGLFVVVHGVLWAAAGLGFVFMYDSMRLMSVNQGNGAGAVATTASGSRRYSWSG